MSQLKSSLCNCSRVVLSKQIAVAVRYIIIHIDVFRCHSLNCYAAVKFHLKAAVIGKNRVNRCL